MRQGAGRGGGGQSDGSSEPLTGGNEVTGLLHVLPAEAGVPTIWALGSRCAGRFGVPAPPRSLAQQTTSIAVSQGLDISGHGWTRLASLGLQGHEPLTASPSWMKIP